VEGLLNLKEGATIRPKLVQFDEQAPAASTAGN
jgi:hypothetical protein